MKKIMSFFLILCICIGIMPMTTVSALKKVYYAGPRYLDMTDEDCTKLENASMIGTQLTLKEAGSATFEFYIPFNAESLTVVFDGTPVPLQINDSTNTYSMDPGEQTTCTHTFDKVVAKGEQKFTISAEEAAKITQLRFNKKPILSGTTFKDDTFVLPALSDEEYAIENAVLIHLDSSAIMVRGATRYINLDDPTEKPLTIDGTAYLPVHTLTRALNSYYEEIYDKRYVLVRRNNMEMMFTPEFSYIDNGDGKKQAIDNCIVYQGERAFMPVRFFVDAIGMCIDYRDRLIAIDDNRFYVEDELEDGKVRNYIMSQLGQYQGEEESGKVYHVAQTDNASDSNDGSQAAPFRTISRAGEVAKAGDTVIVHEGVYRETVTVKNNGTGTAPIVFQAAEGEDVTISALEEIDTFIDYENNCVVGVYPWDLGDGRNQVFYNGKSVPEARYPNTPAIQMGPDDEPLSDNWPVLGDIKADIKDDKHFTSETLLQEEEEDYWKGAYIVTMRGYCYALSNARVDKSKKGELWVTDTSTTYWDVGTQGQWNYAYLVGHRNAMDLPGEWVVQNNVLFMIPPEGETAETLVVEGKKRQLVADLADNKFVQLRGFKTIGGSMRLNNSEACMIKDCAIEYNNHFILSKDQHSGFIDDCNRYDENGAPPRGEVGLYIGGRNNIFANNYVSEAAGAAVYCSGLYTYIEENYIKNCGYAGSYVAGLNFMGEAWKGKTNPVGGYGVYANTVYNAGRAPIHQSRPGGVGNWPIVPHEVAYNDFHNGMLTSLDAGLTYAYQAYHGNDRLTAKMHHNLVYYTLTETNPYSFGIYQDGGTQYIDTYENVVFTTDPDVWLTHYPPVSITYNQENWGVCNVWSNTYHRGVEGGVEGLKPEHYPNEKPFIAGSSYGREEYLVNYNSRTMESEEPAVCEIDDMSEGVTIDEKGYAKFSESGQWVLFKDVEFGEGSNYIDFYYRGDQWNYDSVNERVSIVIDDLETGRSYLLNDLKVRTPDEELAAEMMSRRITSLQGKHDVYIVSNKCTSVYPVAVSPRYQAAERKSTTPGIFYGGDFDDYVEPQGTTMTPNSKDGTTYGMNYNFVNNTWRGMELMYYGVELTEATKQVVIKYNTAAPYHGQNIQLRIDSATAAPIAEFTTEDIGWTKYSEVTIPLTKQLEPGTYNFILTFESETGGKTSNIFFVKFHDLATEETAEETTEETTEETK